MNYAILPNTCKNGAEAISMPTKLFNFNSVRNLLISITQPFPFKRNPTLFNYTLTGDNPPMQIHTPTQRIQSHAHLIARQKSPDSAQTDERFSNKHSFHLPHPRIKGQWTTSPPFYLHPNTLFIWERNRKYLRFHGEAFMSISEWLCKKWQWTGHCSRFCC